MAELAASKAKNRFNLAFAKYLAVFARERLVLNNAAVGGIFTSDPYIHNDQSRSVLCAPVFNRDELTDILYLENTVARGDALCLPMPTSP